MNRYSLFTIILLSAGLQGCAVTTALNIATETAVTGVKAAGKVVGTAVDLVLPDGDEDEEDEEEVEED